MGQFFVVVNLDKGLQLDLGKFCWELTGIMSFFLKQSGSWNGDRIIIIGDYASSIPPGILNSVERDMVEFAGNAYSYISSLVGKDVDYLYDEPRPHGIQTLALVNLSIREYVREDLFTGENEHPDLSEAIFARCTWTDDICSMGQAEKLWYQGSWAGSRLTIGDLEDYKNKTGYKDITDRVFYEVYTLWNLNRSESCDCHLCVKFRAMKKEWSKPHTEGWKTSSHIASDAAMSLSDDGPSPTVIQPGPTFLRQWPRDIQHQIFAELSALSLASCALTCRAFYDEATITLYRNVVLSSPKQTKVFPTTLRNSVLKQNSVRKLSIPVKIDAEYRQHVDSILKQVPELKHLILQPCWLSLGDLATENYSFQLESLWWGLIPDDSLNQFLRSQPSVKTFRLPLNYRPRSAWFEFWPDVLPNVETITCSYAMKETLEGLKSIQNRDVSFDL
ncbi:hypothetical protein FRC17_003350 [Serendipita sp. 399]|nr:hypothetical protein FRC17_003350 [Serendipita sp. 399]